MNRKTRRAAGSSGQSQQGRVQQGHAQSDDGAAQIGQRFNEAVRLHNAGQLGAATEIYRQILVQDPAHLRSLQNLGAIAVDLGHHQLAVELFNSAIALDEAMPAYHRNIAMAYAALGQLDQAVVHGRRAIALKPDEVGAHLILGEVLEKQRLIVEALDCYETALALDPDNAPIHVKLGKLRLMLKQPAQAAASLERALDINPQSAIAYFHFGNLHSQNGDHQQAVDCYLRAIELDPENLTAHTNMCAAMLDQKKYAEAIAHYRQILAYKPDFAEGYAKLANAYQLAGDQVRSFETACQALRLAETAQTKLLIGSALVELVNSRYVLPVERSDILIRALNEAWVWSDRLMWHGINLIRADADIAACLDRAKAAAPNLLPADALYGPVGFKAVSLHPVFRAMLQSGLIGHLGLERFLTNARFCLLQVALASKPGDQPDADALVFYAALSRQCFINEYVYALTDAEQNEIERLRTDLSSTLQKNADVPVLWLVGYAAYAPLSTLQADEALLKRTWPDPVERLLAQQVREPLAERGLRDMIPQLTPIDDRVSVLVRGQYEENPYPRWVKYPLPLTRRTIDGFLQKSFPDAKFHRLGKKEHLDFLVAGCGTGLQLLGVPQAIMGACVLAVDLSLSSLCYAKRMVETLNVGNIEFGHGDLLQLDVLGRQFDVIECGGVLHHLDDPEAGWRKLVSLLRPNGLMRIALYSEAARSTIVEVRNRAAAEGFGQSSEDIRRFRQEFLANADAALVKAITKNVDFFSTSMCRDLLFHVQEHRFTVPRIKAFLENNGLVLVVFEASPSVQRRFEARFPEPDMSHDLDNWHLFEQEHPDTFTGMYHFWVQKAGPAAA